jgi:hypothetical protein
MFYRKGTHGEQPEIPVVFSVGPGLSFFRGELAGAESMPEPFDSFTQY